MLFRVRAAGQSAPVNDHEVVIGRSPYCTLMLGDESVSRVHAVVRRCFEQIEITDMHSSNGTFVNGRRITGSMLVSPTDAIRLGDVLLVIEAFESPETSDTHQVHDTGRAGGPDEPRRATPIGRVQRRG
jgi:pSer/pThr/pTyr-binding forkhead associated (FHA) protein